MTAGTSPIIDHLTTPAERRQSAVRIVPFVANTARRSFTAIDGALHAGQLGPIRDAAVGRHLGSRI